MTAVRKEWEDYPPPVRDPATGCLRWQGPHHTRGYGKIGARRYAHRVAWERVNGPIPAGQTIDHVHARGCRHRDCVEVAHMELVTRSPSTHSVHSAQPSSGVERRVPTDTAWPMPSSTGVRTAVSSATVGHAITSGARSGSVRSEALEIPASVRAEVYARDLGFCRCCGKCLGERQGLHHIHYGGDYTGMGGRRKHEVKNVITLCWLPGDPAYGAIPCHQRVHQDKGLWVPVLEVLVAQPALTGFALLRSAAPRTERHSRLARSASGASRQPPGTSRPSRPQP